MRKGYYDGDDDAGRKPPSSVRRGMEGSISILRPDSAQVTPTTSSIRGSPPGVSSIPGSERAAASSSRNAIDPTTKKSGAKMGDSPREGDENNVAGRHDVSPPMTPSVRHNHLSTPQRTNGGSLQHFDATRNLQSGDANTMNSPVSRVNREENDRSVSFMSSLRPWIWWERRPGAVRVDGPGRGRAGSAASVETPPIAAGAGSNNEESSVQSFHDESSEQLVSAVLVDNGANELAYAEASVMEEPQWWQRRSFLFIVIGLLCLLVIILPTALYRWTDFPSPASTLPPTRTESKPTTSPSTLPQPAAPRPPPPTQLLTTFPSTAQPSAPSIGESNTPPPTQLSVFLFLTVFHDGPANETGIEVRCKEVIALNREPGYYSKRIYDSFSVAANEDCFLRVIDSRGSGLRDGEVALSCSYNSHTTRATCRLSDPLERTTGEKVLIPLPWMFKECQIQFSAFLSPEEPSAAPTTGVIPGTRRTQSGGGNDTNQCYLNLIESDGNDDRRVDRQEYILFVKLIGPDIFFADVDDFDDLPRQLQFNFNALACLCREAPAAADDCCLEDDAHISNDGAAPDETPSDEQQAYLETVCFHSEAAVARVIEIIAPTTQPSSTPAPSSHGTRPPDTIVPPTSSPYLDHCTTK